MTYIHRRTEKVSPATLQEVNKALDRDFPYWESSGSLSSPREMAASNSGPARSVNLRSIR